MDRRNFLRTALAGAAGLSATAILGTEAEAAAPVYLGRRKVDPFLDRDVLHVGAGLGLFRKISFRAKGNDVYVYDVRVDTIHWAGDQHFNTRLKIAREPHRGS